MRNMVLVYIILVDHAFRRKRPVYQVFPAYQEKSFLSCLFSDGSGVDYVVRGCRVLQGKLLPLRNSKPLN